MKRRLTSLLLAIMLLVLSGCSGKPAEQPPTPEPQPARTVKIAVLRGPTAVSIIPMLDAKTGLTDRVNAEYQLYNSPDLLVPDLVKGQVDAALLPPNLAAKIYNQGIAYQLAGVTCWGVMYVAGDNKSITGIKDLKGQKVSVTDKGATPDLVFNYLLQKNGLKPTDLTLDYSLGQTELAQSMAAGRVKTGLLVEPWLTVVTSGNPAMSAVIDIQKEWQAATTNQPLPQTCLIVKKDLASEESEATTSLLTKVKEAIDWVNAHPEEAGALVEKNEIGMKAAVAAQAIPRLNLRWEGAADSRAALDNYFTIIHQSDPTSTGGKLPDDGFYYQQ